MLRLTIRNRVPVTIPKVKIVFGLMLLLFTSLGGDAWAELPFQVGERLVFDIRWAGIHAGTAELAVEEEVEYGGRSVLRLTSTARSSPFISRIYPVEYSAESLWDPAGGFSRRYRIRQREGRYRRQLEIFLNQEERMALYYRNQDSRRIFFIPHGVQDALSTLFKFRTFPASVGSWRTVPTFASRRSWDVEVEVEAREVIETPGESSGPSSEAEASLPGDLPPHGRRPHLGDRRPLSCPPPDEEPGADRPLHRHHH